MLKLSKDYEEMIYLYCPEQIIYDSLVIKWRPLENASNVIYVIIHGRARHTIVPALQYLH